jgi:hypothetical protein
VNEKDENKTRQMRIIFSSAFVSLVALQRNFPVFLSHNKRKKNAARMKIQMKKYHFSPNQDVSDRKIAAPQMLQTAKLQ